MGAYWAITCPGCGGTEDPDCPHCEGEGSIPMRRCPSSVASGVEGFVEAWIAQSNGDGWPVVGARIDQARWYVQARALADAEKGLLDEAADKARRRLSGVGQ